jgi:hypothetical protein
LANSSALLQNLFVSARMSLLGRHDLNAAVAVLRVVPGHEPLQPHPCLREIFKSLARIRCLELEREKQGRREMVVIAQVEPADPTWIQYHRQSA